MHAVIEKKGSLACVANGVKVNFDKVNVRLFEAADVKNHMLVTGVEKTDSVWLQPNVLNSDCPACSLGSRLDRVRVMNRLYYMEKMQI